MTAPLPDNVDIVRVRGYWFDQDGGGSGRTITFAPLVGNLTDAAAFSYIKTETVVVTPDPDTAYFFADLIASNDPDLTPSAWTITLQGQTSQTVGIDYNATVQDVGGGVNMKAVWLTDAAPVSPPPPPIDSWYTSVQTNAAIAEALDGFESTSAVQSVSGRTGDVVLVEGDITDLVADLAAKVAKSTVTTKGDLLAGTGSGTVVRRGVSGNNGWILTEDSSQTDGMHWAAAPAGYSDEQARDAIGTALVEGANITITVDDTANTITIDSDASGSVTSVGNADTTIAVTGTASDPLIGVNVIPESKVTNLVTDLAGKAATSHNHAGADITSGTVAIARIPTGTTGSTVPFGNDARFSDSRTPTVHKTTHAAGGSDALSPADIGAAPLTSPSFTGVSTFEAIVNNPVDLTDAATIAVDATAGNLLRVTLGGDRTMGAPSTPSDGQQIRFELTQDGTGGRTITWTSGAGGYAFDVSAPVLSTTPGARDFLVFVYNDSADRWRFAPVQGGVTGIAAADATIVIAGTSATPTVAVGEIAQSQVIDLGTDLAAKANLASPTFTGTAGFEAATFSTATFATTINTPVTLTDAATIVVDAALGNYLRVTLAGNRTMGVPANPVDGQQLLFELLQDATGSRTVTWTSGAGGFAFDVPTPVLTVTPAERDYLTFVYDSITDRWRFASTPTGVTSVTAANSTITVAGTAAAPTVAVGTIAQSQVTSLVSDLAGKAAASHVHAGADITTGTVAYARLPVGTTASTVAAGDDSRMTNARTPTAHKTTHATGGGDALTPSDIGAASSTHSHAEADVTGLVTDLAGKASTVHTHAASDTTSGVFTSARLPLVASTPYTVTFASSLTLDPTLGNNPQITATGPTTIGVSTTGVLSGQQILLEVLAQTTGRVVTLTGISIAAGLTAATTVTSGKVGMFGLRYSSLAGTWFLMSYAATV